MSSPALCGIGLLGACLHTVRLNVDFGPHNMDPTIISGTILGSPILDLSREEPPSKALIIGHLWHAFYTPSQVKETGSWYPLNPKP